MPLVYDDIPGSWGTYSKHWPKVQCSTKDEASRAFIACTKANVVPYGSYVLVDYELRVETEELRAALVKYLAETPFKTYDELREHFISTKRW
jgi:hypothetical protein